MSKGEKMAHRKKGGKNSKSPNLYMEHYLPPSFPPALPSLPSPPSLPPSLLFTLSASTPLAKI